MNTFFDLILIFSIYSFLGWTMETLFASIMERKLVNRGFLTGFFCPIYGFCAIMIIKSFTLIDVLFGKSFFAPVIGMIFSIVLVTFLEYITGFILEKAFNSKWWDYSNNKFNLHGYICLQYSILWGFLAFLLVKAIHPAISNMLTSFLVYAKGVLAFCLLAYFILDTAKSVIDTLDLRKVILNYSSLSLNKYYEKIIKYERFFLAFPRLLVLNAGIINRDIRSILNDKIDKIKVELKSRIM